MSRIDIYRLLVWRCFIPSDFNEGLPLYILDLGGAILVLFGQWLFDPHTLVSPAGAFEKWTCEQNFFSDFSIRCSMQDDLVLELRVGSCSFVAAEQLQSPVSFNRLREYQLIAGRSEALLSDLSSAGLIG